MYHLLKQNKVMRTVAHLILLGLLAIFTIIVTGLFLSNAHAQERCENPRSGTYYLMVKSDNRIPWENLGMFHNVLACENAARNLMRIPRQDYICAPLSI